MNQQINGVTPSLLSVTKNQKPDMSSGKAQTSFANTLKTALEKVNDTQIASNQKTGALANGQIDDLHDVMITAQKASITLETSVQVQRKVIDAYNEIMHMQV